MALFQWVTRFADERGLDTLASTLQPLGLDVDLDFSSHVQIVLRDRRGAARSLDSRVTVLASRLNQSNRDVQLEVRSSEPMLSRGTRCESVAISLKQLFPPLG